MTAAALPVIRGTYRHRKSKNLYTVDGIFPIKVGATWSQDGLITYESNETGERYSRLTEDFMDSFDFVSYAYPQAIPVKPETKKRIGRDIKRR